MFMTLEQTKITKHIFKALIKRENIVNWTCISLRTSVNQQIPFKVKKKATKKIQAILVSECSEYQN